jgi:hypothetical protein
MEVKAGGRPDTVPCIGRVATRQSVMPGPEGMAIRAGSRTVTSHRIGCTTSIGMLVTPDSRLNPQHP